MIELNKETVEFVEPQSMNYDKKINSTYAQFLSSKNAKVVEVPDATV